MEEITITIEVENRAEAYQAVNKLGLRYKVKKATFDKEDYEFGKDLEIKDFLKNKENEQVKRMVSRR
jgi:hypothetical protein